ncbi:unnamed protein product [marine sediment metagenome]|uniref:Uncharacterized protein n=1 Tax=marine sediment metagenome TaxID=412755 RepID=X1S9Y1_9ZZZZ
MHRIESFLEANTQTQQVIQDMQDIKSYLHINNTLLTEIKDLLETQTT